jgi:hypothetical protein
VRANNGKFVDPPSLTFQQIFFSTDRRGESATKDASRALAVLIAGVGTDNVPAGDPSLLPAEMKAATPRDIANVFGEAFAADIEDAPVERWIGPVESPFGAHLVRLSARVAGRLPPLVEIRTAVVREWEAAQQEAANEAFYQGLRSKYQVRIEGEIGELLRRQAARPEPAKAGDGRS